MKRPGCIVWLVWYETTKRAGSSSILVLIDFILEKSTASLTKKWVQKYTSNEVGTEVHFRSVLLMKVGRKVHFKKCTLKGHLRSILPKYTS